MELFHCQSVNLSCTFPMNSDKFSTRIFGKHFKSPKTVNSGIPGDKTQHVLWRAKNLFIPPSVTFIAVHCGTNNLDYNNPIGIAKGILNIGKSLLENRFNFNRYPTTRSI